VKMEPEARGNGLRWFPGLLRSLPWQGFCLARFGPIQGSQSQNGRSTQKHRTYDQDSPHFPVHGILLSQV
jgi:hypothetical protein